LFGRKLKTRIPTADTVISKKQKTSEEIDKERGKQATFYNRGAKELPPLTKGKSVRFQRQGETGAWERRQVQQEVAPRSYVIHGENGGEYIMNRQHISPATQVPDVPSTVAPQADEMEMPQVPDVPSTVPMQVDETEMPQVPDVPSDRRSTRERHVPPRFKDFILITQRKGDVI
jgi:hypothetical protein